MSDKYNEVLANLTAEDQIYAFEEVLIPQESLTVNLKIPLRH